MYEYRGEVLRVIDGDSLVVEIDLGFRIKHTVVVRLAGIDAPEVVGESRARGLAAARWIEDTLKVLPHEDSAWSGEVVVRTMKNPGDKFGRWLGIVFHMVPVDPRNPSGAHVQSPESLNDLLVKSGHAKPYDGGKR